MEDATPVEIAFTPLPSPPSVEELLERRKRLSVEKLKQAWTQKVQLISDINEIIAQKAMYYSEFSITVPIGFKKTTQANDVQPRTEVRAYPEGILGPWILDYFKKAYEGRASVNSFRQVTSHAINYKLSFDFSESMPGDVEVFQPEVSEWRKPITRQAQYPMCRCGKRCPTPCAYMQQYAPTRTFIYKTR